jgi:hypothetical protein
MSPVYLAHSLVVVIIKFTTNHMKLILNFIVTLLQKIFKENNNYN